MESLSTDSVYKRDVERLDWIDMARGIAMLLIIIGHCVGIPDWLRLFIFSFHVPLFFILSGYVYKYKDNNILKDLKQLIFPYVLTVIAVLGFQIYSNNGLNTEVIYKTIKSAIYGYGSTYGEVELIGCIWFLPTIFIARCVMNFFMCFKLSEKYNVVISLGLMLLGIQISRTIWIPLNVDIAFVAVGFIYVGYSMKRLNFKANINIIVGCLIFWFVSLNCGSLEISIRLYDFWVVKFLGAISGSIIVMYFCTKLEPFRWVNKTLSFIGRHTLLLLCIHDLDWRLPFDVWWGFLQQFEGTKIYFVLSVACRMGFDILIMCIIIVIIGGTKCFWKKAFMERGNKR